MNDYIKKLNTSSYFRYFFLVGAGADLLGWLQLKKSSASGDSDSASQTYSIVTALLKYYLIVNSIETALLKYYLIVNSIETALLEYYLIVNSIGTARLKYYLIVNSIETFLL